MVLLFNSTLKGNIINKYFKVKQKKMEFQANEGQKLAIELIQKNYKVRGFMLMTGKAGTGKSQVLFEAIKELTKTAAITCDRICVAVPTHKLVDSWKQELENKGLFGIQVKTVHSLVKFFPTILDNGERPLVPFEDKEQSTKEVKGILPFSLLIVDEAFMLPKQLVQAIYSHGYLASIMTGDPNQTLPIKEACSHLSTITDFTYKAHLTENMRQKDKELIQIVDDILLKGALYIPDFLNKRDFDLAFFSAVKQNSENTLYLAYLNKTCLQMSDMLRSVQGVKNVSLADEGEIIKVGTLMHKGKIQIPSDSLVTVKEVNKENSSFKIEYKGKIYQIKKDVKNEEQDMRIKAKLANTKKTWKEYYDLCDTFVTYYHPCVSTVHSSQGMTVENVFLNWKDICRCKTDPNLAYVAASRSSKFLYFC